jgi:hypothetical protein
LAKPAGLDGVEICHVGRRPKIAYPTAGRPFKMLLRRHLDNQRHAGSRSGSACTYGAGLEASMDKDKVKKINELGDRIFLSPATHNYEYLVDNALGGNTYRGFHRIDKQKPGAKVAFTTELRSQESKIIRRLRQIRTEKELTKLENEVAESIKPALSNIRESQLESYNKIRKPLDIFFEHLVSMKEDFDSIRKTITPFLFLPLDSWMFKSPEVFPDEELKRLRIKRTFTFQDIVKRAHYFEIQDFLKMRAEREGLESRIYFDLLWNNRYKKKNAKNLFETNPGT